MNPVSVPPSGTDTRPQAPTTSRPPPRPSIKRDPTFTPLPPVPLKTNWRMIGGGLGLAAVLLVLMYILNDIGTKQARSHPRPYPYPTPSSSAP
jgi:hypothetical protein